MYIPKNLTTKQKVDRLRARAFQMDRKGRAMIGEARGIRQAADALEHSDKAKHHNAGLPSLTP